MPTVTAAVHIAAPPRVIWRLLEDFARMPEYVHFVRTVMDYSEPPLRVGSKYSEISKPGPVETLSDWTVTDVDLERRQVHVTDMPDLKATLTIVLEPEGDGTLYRQTTEFQLLPKVRPVGWLIEALFMRRRMQQHMEKIVHNVKRIAETEHA